MYLNGTFVYFDIYTVELDLSRIPDAIKNDVDVIQGSISSKLFSFKMGMREMSRTDISW